jgi:hypothetical protein
MYSNVQSLLNKIDELRIFVVDQSPDIIALTETWLHSEINDAEVQISGYQFFRNDRPSGRKGGGVAIYVKNAILVTENRSQSQDIDASESLCIFVQQLNTPKLWIFLLYRPPNQAVDVDDRILREISDCCTNNNVIIIGDFNAPGIDWEIAHTDMPDFSFQCKLITTTLDNFLKQHVPFATRFREGQRTNCLDLIFTKDEDDVSNLQSMAPLGSSDHVILTWEYILFAPSKPDTAERRNIWKADIPSIVSFVRTINWQSILHDDAEESWRRFRTFFESVIDTYCPLMLPRRQDHPKWLTRQVKLALKQKARCWRLARETGLASHHERYKRSRNLCKILIRDSKNSLDAKILQESLSKPKKFYSYINSKMKNQERIPCLRNHAGEEFSDDIDKANLFSGYFQSVFTDEDDLCFSRQTDIFSTNTLETIEINENLVRIELLHLNPSKSAGPDGIPSKLLKDLADELALPLSFIYKQTIETGLFPEDWKTATISPIHKGGSKTLPDNYRPISLTCICCKILERIIKKQIVAHLDTNRLLCEAQHGFRAGRSCLTNLLYCFESWTENLDKRTPVDIIYFDFKKAFDSVPHKRLLHKISMYGITGRLYKWIEQFLTGRRQNVHISSSVSDWALVRSGVPQGSVLGPLLFLIYIDDLPSEVRSQIVMFADDVKIWRPISTSDDVVSLQQDIDTMQLWADRWLLKFNASKCVSLQLRLRGTMGESRYQLNQTCLNNVPSQRDLGITIDCSLKPEIHCAKAANKAMSIMRRIKRTFNVITPEIFGKIYGTYVRPHLEYGVQVWHPWFKKDIALLSSVQRRCTKLVTGFYNLDFHTREKSLNLFPLPYRLLRGDLILAFRIIRLQDCGIQFEDLFTYATTSHLRGHPWKLQKCRSTSLLRRSFFSQRIVNFWNSLPEDVVSAQNLLSFKSRLDVHFLDLLDSS